MSYTFQDLAFKEPREMLSDQSMQALEALEQWLRNQGKPDVADELYRYRLDLETMHRRIAVQHERLSNVLFEAEAWFSSDHSESDLDTAWSEVVSIPGHIGYNKLSNGRR